MLKKILLLLLIFIVQFPLWAHLSVVHATGIGDFDLDGDVDGRDLGVYSSQVQQGRAAVTPEQFAGRFGKIDPGPYGTCSFARATWYPIYRENGIPQGTCGFGAVADDMPRIFLNGYVTAPNEDFYNKGADLAGTCGECYEITGPKGSIVVMAADICDRACCDNCRGDVVAFDIENERWGEIVDQSGGHVAVSYRWVPCPVVGNVKLAFTSGNPGPYWFRLTVYNHRVGIKSVEVKGRPDKGTKGEWTKLTRTWTNYFEWDRDPQVDVGLPITLRVTSNQGQTIEFPMITQFTPAARYTANGQFDNLDQSDPTACSWPGPNEWVFREGLEGILGLMWRDWGSWGLQAGMPNYASQDNCYEGSKCVAVGPIDAWGAIQIGYPTYFPPQMFKGVQFCARTQGGVSDTLKFYYVGKDHNGNTAASNKIAIGQVASEWRCFSILFKDLGDNIDVMRVLLLSNQSNIKSVGIVLDNIKLF